MRKRNDMGTSIHFPALVMTKGSVDKIDYKYLVADKRSLSKSYHRLIVDSTGRCFDTDKVTQVGGVSLLYSIKLIGHMVRVEPILNKPVYTIDLQQLKEMVIATVKKNPGNFTARLDIKGLIREIDSAETIPQLINIF